MNTVLKKKSTTLKANHKSTVSLGSSNSKYSKMNSQIASKLGGLANEKERIKRRFESNINKANFISEAAKEENELTENYLTEVVPAA